MRRYQIEVGGRTHVVDVQELTANRFHVSVGEQELDVELSAAEDVTETTISPEIVPSAGSNGAGAFETLLAARFKPAPPETLKPMVPAAHPPLPPQPDRGAGGALKAPMPGTITAVETKAGDTVVTGQVLVRLEAMKMVNAIKASRSGMVAAVLVQPGQSVGYGHVLVTFKEA
jgi:glutaconyl-CoA/methylmalonyl-CoA decarboxylase subunit gamma